MSIDQPKNMINPINPEHTDAVVRQKPRDDDPLEVAIREKIRAQVSETPWATETISRIRLAQIEYMKEMIAHVGNSAWVHERTQAFLKEIAHSLTAKIVEGREFLNLIPKGNPALVMTNHLGIYKLAGIDPKKELGVEIAGYNFMYPSPLYFGGISPITEEIGDDLSYVSNDFPGVFGTIHRESGFIHVPPATKEQKGRTEALLDQVKEAIKTHPNIAIVNFPEGGTSGKYTGLGPYDLDPFKTGGYVIASQLKIPVIPTAQYFDPKEGLLLKVFPPFIPEITDKSGYEQYASNDRMRMQEWFDQQKTS